MFICSRQYSIVVPRQQLQLYGCLSSRSPDGRTVQNCLHYANYRAVSGRECGGGQGERTMGSPAVELAFDSVDGLEERVDEFAFESSGIDAVHGAADAEAADDTLVVVDRSANGDQSG